jgi:hypothetical protein
MTDHNWARGRAVSAYNQVVTAVAKWVLRFLWERPAMIALSC